MSLQHRRRRLRREAHVFQCACGANVPFFRPMEEDQPAKRTVKSLLVSITVCVCVVGFNVRKCFVLKGEPGEGTNRIMKMVNSKAKRINKNVCSFNIRSFEQRYIFLRRRRNGAEIHSISTVKWTVF